MGGRDCWLSPRAIWTGILGSIWRQLGMLYLGRKVSWHYWVEARDGAKPAIPRTAQQGSPVPNCPMLRARNLVQTKQSQKPRSYSGATREGVSRWLPAASLHSSHTMSVVVSSREDATAKNQGFTMSNEKWAPRWERLQAWYPGSACPLHSDTDNRSLWFFTTPPQARSPPDPVWLGLARCPYHKTIPHREPGRRAEVSPCTKATHCPPRGPSLGQDPDQGFIRAKGSATTEHLCFISMATDPVFHLRW